VQTPLWLPIVIAAMGLLGTVAAGVGGVYVTHRLAHRRESEAWRRERERERERWAREDQALTFEHRRASYTAFFQAIEELIDDATDNAFNRQPKKRLDAEWYLPTYMKLQQLIIYATPEAADAAYTVFETVRSMGNWSIRYDEDGRSRKAFDDLHSIFGPEQFELLKLIRRDLLIPGAALEVPPWGEDSPQQTGAKAV